MIQLIPIFSGSGGNCTLVRTEDTTVLVDVGLGYKLTLSALQRHNVSPDEISAVFVTHEHSDHTGGIAQWTGHHRVKLFAPRDICPVLCDKIYCGQVVPVGKTQQVDDLTVDVYECSHDSAACVGYRFGDGKGSFVATVTDTGCTRAELVDFLAPCRGIQLESNHDVNMLKNGPYPYQLKRRILSDFGHLSNDQASGVLQNLIGSNVTDVVLAHLSEHNNTAELAFDTAVNMYAAHNLIEGRDVNVHVAKPRCNDIVI